MSTEIDRKIVDSLERLSTAIQVFLEKQTEELDVNTTQGKVLMYLHQHPDQDGKISRMATEMRRTKPTISDAVDTLVEDGYVERTLSERDRRMMELKLTDRGTEAAQQLNRWPDVLEEYMEGVSSSEKQTVFQFLIQLIEGALKEGAIPTARMCTTCRYFNEDPEEEDRPFYCDLLDIPLDPESLRIDCDEQEPEEIEK